MHQVAVIHPKVMALDELREALAVTEAEATEHPSLALTRIKHLLNRALADAERLAA